MANTHEHLEHAEHAGHHAEDPFNKRVAVTMAIVAACLAGIAMVGHRTHNTVLQLQGDANRLRTEAATAEVEKSNLFAWYQSKRLRQSSAEMSAEMVQVLAGDDAGKKAAADKWLKQAKGYNVENEDHDSLPELRKRGTEAGKKAEELTKKAAAVRDEADHVHHQADRLDIAHLLAEIGLVVCSIALLTKKKVYWLIGITAAVLALGTGISARLIPHPPHADGPSAVSH